MVITKPRIIKTEAAAGDATGLTWGMRRACLFAQVAGLGTFWSKPAEEFSELCARVRAKP
jgi:hypothetical protein